MHDRQTYLWPVVLMTLISGCNDLYTEERVSFRDDCPVWRCGFNAAEVNGLSIRELNLDGLANDDGVQIIKVIAPGKGGKFSLDFEGDALIARSDDGVVLRGAELVGAKILVRTPEQSVVPIKIAKYQEIASWAEGAPPVPTYGLRYPHAEKALGERNVCNGDLPDQLMAAVTVLGGETYDLAAKTVHPDRARWVTLACAGSAAAKMRLMNYGPHADFDGEGHPATVLQRQATLKMITADYCGGGHSYTENGTPLEWENHGGTVDTTSPQSALEAIWTATGALCLDQTRLPDEDVACALPSCAAYSLDQGEWATRVPP